MSFPEQFGPYELHELINSGGMADLYLATDEKKQPVAIRRLRQRLWRHRVRRRLRPAKAIWLRRLLGRSSPTCC